MTNSVSVFSLSSSLDREAALRLNGGDYILTNLTKVVEMYVGDFPDGVWHIFVYRADNGARLRHFWGCTEYNPSYPTPKDTARMWAANWCPPGEAVVCSEKEQVELERRTNYIMREARPLSFLRGATKRAHWRKIYEARKRLQAIKDPMHRILWIRYGFDYTPGAPSAIWHGVV